VGNDERSKEDLDQFGHLLWSAPRASSKTEIGQGRWTPTERTIGGASPSVRPALLDQRIGRLVPAVAAGFALQTLTGALTYLLPVVFGRGAYGNRRLGGMLELAWPLRVAAAVLALLAVEDADPAGG
jgi:hypothetical protein